MGDTRKAAVAAFLLGGLVVFGIGLFMIGDRRRLFDESFEVSAVFSHLAGLQEGAPVRIAGVEAGEVLEIRYPDSPRSPFRVRMRVIEDLHPLVRENSEASIRIDGLVGNKLIYIRSGTESSPPVPDGGEIPGRDPLELADLVDRASEAIGTFEESFSSIRSDAETAIETVHIAVQRTDRLLQTVGKDFETMSSAAAEIAEDARVIVADVRAGKGTIGKFVTEDAIYQHAQNVAQRLDEMSEDAAVIVTDVKELSQTAKDAFVDFESEQGRASGLMTDVKDTVAAAHEAMTDMAESMESLKRNFLFRGLFLERGFFDIDEISQREYVAGVLTKGNHRTLRRWLDASELFVRGDDGEEELSTVGKAAIDSAMIDILRFPRATPLMVEGYSDLGSLDRQFLTARQRAFLVREYIVKRFHRDPNYTGFIALETLSPDDEHSDGEEEGVMLSLFYEETEEDAPRHRMIR